jgi:hypothetical protein
VLPNGPVHHTQNKTASKSSPKDQPEIRRVQHHSTINNMPPMHARVIA